MALKILAYGANGAQMQAGTQALVDAGHHVRAFTRSNAGADRWRTAGVDVVTGDMGDKDALRRASEGQDALFLHVPLITDPNDDRNAYGLNALESAREVGIERVVWNTGGPIMDPDSTTDTGAIVLRALREGEFSYLGLVPITYMENLLGPWTATALAQGKVAYPTPANFKMQWGAAADFGRVADKALLGDLPNEVLPLGGPVALDGNDLARIMGGVLGQSLTYDVMSPAEFETQLGALAGPHVAGMIAGMYGGVQANPDQFQSAFLADSSVIEARYDLKLTPFEDWVSARISHFTQQG